MESSKVFENNWMRVQYYISFLNIVTVNFLNNMSEYKITSGKMFCPNIKTQWLMVEKVQVLIKTLY